MKCCLECQKEFDPKFDYWKLCYRCYVEKQNGRSSKTCTICNESFVANQEKWTLCRVCYLDEQMERSGRPWRHPRLKWLDWLFG